ncbi:hypothetical protein SEA_PATELGO_223 [Streptomyces phage Patelgo]|nr:hypothetical protein SEA_PATELGO_223 [Streptomyces phage Patelgo]
MEMLNVSKVLGTKLVDGRVYFDLEQLLSIMYDSVNSMAELATKIHDPVLGTMNLGVANMCKALDSVLTLQKEAHGVWDQPKPCGGTQPHTEHLRSVGSRIVRCPGVAKPEET